ncbi:MAG TPA: hypothetical protein VH592_15935 [Gemmataceae bacterium]|jgi:pimeloyl-ACP methyl ester carboxylesterase
MTWPNATDYNAAVQNPQLCFRDEDLRQGQAVGDLLGLPLPHSGNFADVYQIRGADGQSWAVKCFTRPVSGLRARYQAISEHLRLAQRAFMVEFQFLDEGICIRGQWHPLVKMRWVEGYCLNEFVCEQLNKPVLLEKLAELWVRLAQELRDADMAHGDLQHGNVLLVPDSKGSSLALKLKLIDYDGMFVPALADRPSEEVGHPHYQHPRRLHEGGYNRQMDRFSHLLIYTALRCLRVGGEKLWLSYDNQENLLFREEDFLQPSKSRLLHELWGLPDREVRGLVGHLLLASQGPLGAVPTLDELLDDNGTRPLSDVEEARVNNLLDGNAAHPSRDRKGAALQPLADTRSSDSSMRTKTRTRVRPTDLDDTNIISRGVKTAVMRVPPVPQSPRRSAAEIELDAQPPMAADQLPHDPERPDPLVSRLSHPAWLATLGLIAIISFFVVKVMVSSTAPQPTIAAAIPRSDIEKVDENRLPPPVREVPRPTPPRLKQEIVPPTSVPKAANLIPKDDSSKVRKEIPRVRLREDIPNSLSLEAGAKTGLRIALDRNGYDGTVEILITGLPANISAPPAAIPAALSSATVSIETKVDTEKGEYPVKLLVRSNNQTIEERTITLLVQKPRGWQEKVHFSTVDHVHLAGTLYHGWKSKRGLTVLMLHDLGSNRSSPGWKRLAETLQAEGHTVLTFDFRGHGDSRKVSPQFWRYTVNKYLNSYKLNTIAELQPILLKLPDFPSEYRPWLIEDIAAARTYLDRLHDDPAGPVNTFNLVVIGAGQAAALGSLWLATEGLRFNGSDVGNKIQLRWEEKRSVLQAVWIGMADPLKLRPFGIHSWLEGAHAKPVVPITFIYGEEDIDTYTLLSEPIRKKFGDPFVIPGVRQTGQVLLDTDAQAATRIQKYLVKTFQTLPPTSTAPVNWVPRRIKSLRSFWRLEIPKGKKTVVRWFEAKRVGEESLLPVPFLTLGIPIKGLEEPNFIREDEDDP